MICWSCEKNAGEGALCSGCGAIQPANPAATHFEILGVPREYDVDLALLEKRYRELSRQVHPDRFARADPRARRASMERSVQLNNAWKTLRDPVRRAEYLLSLAGIEVGGEEGTTRPAAGAADGDRERVPVPQELLLEVMELREGLLEARAEGEVDRVQSLAADVRSRKERAMAAVAKALGQSPASPADLEAASGELVAVRYYDRFLEEVEAADDSSGLGVGHG